MATQTIKMVFQFRRDTAANWEANKDVIPAAGEPCFVTDKNILKIGDGETTFENLEPINDVQVEISADGKSVVMEDNVFKLAGFDAAEIGAQPRKTADGIEWIVPSTETVEGLQTAVAGLQSDVKTLQDIVGTSAGEDSLVSRVSSVESAIGILNGDVTVAGSVKKTVADEIDAWANKVTDNGKIDTVKEFIDYVVDHGGEVKKMVSDITTLQGLVGNKSVEEQIAAAGHMAESKAMAMFEQVKYEISHKPVGTLVDYRDKEIRVMVPADTQWTKQNVGATGNANMYYMGFKAYAPAGAVSFKEGDRGVVEDKMYTFDDAFAGVDAFGRKYSICWLALASCDDSGVWTYFGKNSTTSKYIGWDYVVEWYDADGVKIASDKIRINLSNEACHNEIKPFYMAGMDNKIESIAIGKSVLDIIDKQVVIPMGAGLKASDEITIAEDGTLALGKISFNKLVQEEGIEIVMDGGSAV